MPSTEMRPHVLGDPRPPVPPLPVDSDVPRSSADRIGPTASTHRQPPFALLRHAPAHLPPPDSRYSSLDLVDGVQNRPKPRRGSDQDCIQDAMSSVTNPLTVLSGRVIARPLPGLYVPQVLLTRASPEIGWHVIAVDLRATDLGIKVICVRPGTTIRQFLSPGSPLWEELVATGRGSVHFAAMLNLEPCSYTAVFHMQVDTLTLTPLPSFATSSPAGPARPARNRWHRTLLEPPDGFTINLEADDPVTFTVFDKVHHFRLLQGESQDNMETLIARALSVTPELPGAHGVQLLKGIAELPFPQFVLVDQPHTCCTVPLLFRVHPVAVCTFEVPPESSAFSTAFHASEACPGLTGAHHQIARGSAAITGHSGSALPYKPGCVRAHEALVLRGFVFGAARPRRPRGMARHQPTWIEARGHTSDAEQEDSAIRIMVTRGDTWHAHVPTTADVEATRSHIRQQSPVGPWSALKWPPVCPATPGAIPTALLVTADAAEESTSWAVVDIRRVGHPPLAFFQTVPVPHFVDLGTALNILRGELPSLHPIQLVYHDEHLLTDTPRVTGPASTLTLVRHLPRDQEAAAIIPALDLNVVLLERRIALRTAFNRFRTRDWKGRLMTELDGTSSSAASDPSDAPPSFRSGSVGDQDDGSSGLPLPLDTTTTSTAALPGATSTTTTSCPLRRTPAQSTPRIRRCNIISTPSDVHLAQLVVMATCGHSQPNCLPGGNYCVCGGLTQSIHSYICRMAHHPGCCALDSVIACLLA